MRKPTRLSDGESCHRVGKRATHTPTGSAGVVAAAHREQEDGRNTGSPGGGVARANRQPVRDGSGRPGWRRGGRSSVEAGECRLREGALVREQRGKEDWTWELVKA